jgi:hypothetical protein
MSSQRRHLVGGLVAAISRYRPEQMQYTTGGPSASQAERIATVLQRHRHGLDVKALPHGNRHH